MNGMTDRQQRWANVLSIALGLVAVGLLVAMLAGGRMAGPLLVVATVASLTLMVVGIVGAGVALVRGQRFGR
jgi:hypothetical protein